MINVAFIGTSSSMSGTPPSRYAGRAASPGPAADVPAPPPESCGFTSGNDTFRRSPAVLGQLANAYDEDFEGDDLKVMPRADAIVLCCMTMTVIVSDR